MTPAATAQPDLRTVAAAVSSMLNAELTDGLLAPLHEVLDLQREENGLLREENRLLRQQLEEQRQGNLSLEYEGRRRILRLEEEVDRLRTRQTDHHTLRAAK